MKFQDVKTLDQLANMYGDNSQRQYESYDHIIKQYDHLIAHSDPDNEIMVLYINREDGIIKIESMWFDRNGNRVPRPERVVKNK